MDKIIEIINTVLTNSNREPFPKIKLSSHLRDDIGLDSLDLAELTVRIEDEFGVDIFENGLVNTVSEIVNLISSKDNG